MESSLGRLLVDLRSRTNLIFDLDGTLIDPWKGAFFALKGALELVGIPLTDEKDYHWIIGPPISDSLKKILSQHGQDSRLTEAHYLEARLTEAHQEFRRLYDSQGVGEYQVYPGVLELLRSLSEKGRPLFIASSKPEPGPLKILKAMGVAGRFTGIHGATPYGKRKTKTDVLRHMFSVHGLNPKTCVMIGDRHHDCEGAKVFDVPTIGVLWGYGSRNELTTAGAVALVKRPQEVLGLLA